jgi:ribulose-5-phosphate 4-epimerase/fuculose-1-phosphate aldolase
VKAEEGVVQFQAFLERTGRVHLSNFVDFVRARQLLFDLEAIGGDMERYGAAFGNVSVRTGGAAPPGRRSFAITCTQSGGDRTLLSDRWVKVVRYDCVQNSVHAVGPCPPSSESMTHGAIYDASLDIRCVLHGHDPRLWSTLLTLSQPHVPSEFTYGTPEMGIAVSELVRESTTSTWALPGVLAMAGHRDGFLAWGTSPVEAADNFLNAWTASRGPTQTGAVVV